MGWAWLGWTLSDFTFRWTKTTLIILNFNNNLLTTYQGRAFHSMKPLHSSPIALNVFILHNWRGMFWNFSQPLKEGTTLILPCCPFQNSNIEVKFPITIHPLFWATILAKSASRHFRNALSNRKEIMINSFLKSIIESFINLNPFIMKAPYCNHQSLVREDSSTPSLFCRVCNIL